MVLGTWTRILPTDWRPPIPLGAKRLDARTSPVKHSECTRAGTPWPKRAKNAMLITDHSKASSCCIWNAYSGSFKALDMDHCNAYNGSISIVPNPFPELWTALFETWTMVYLVSALMKCVACFTRWKMWPKKRRTSACNFHLFTGSMNVRWEKIYPKRSTLVMHMLHSSTSCKASKTLAIIQYRHETTLGFSPSVNPSLRMTTRSFKFGNRNGTPNSWENLYRCTVFCCPFPERQSTVYHHDILLDMDTR